ncbi:MAG: alpha-ketoglutarate-dependent dioxygenase AlkB, partial [Actinomycetota bacterium]|nr:alpha-ketoglutarate-dependent dioxygenase AlkB [Actinomycetota bacterium]
ACQLLGVKHVVFLGYEDGELQPTIELRRDLARQIRRYRPDVALVNFYDPGARMGMHRDRDERSAEPVVSVSLGDPCVFRFGNPERRGRPWQDLVLASGDLFVFGGPSRFAYHGVCRILPRAQELFGSDPSAGAGAAPEPGAVPDGGAAGMPALPSSTTRGRYNVTLRVSGLRP